MGISLSARNCRHDVSCSGIRNVPTLQIYGVNRQYAIEQVTEAGSDMSRAINSLPDGPAC